MKEQAIELMRKIIPSMYCYSGSGMLSNEYSHMVALDTAKRVMKALLPEFNDVLPEIGLLDFWTQEELDCGY